MINDSILIVNNSPEYSEGINGGSVVSKRNECLIKSVFKNVYIYNHIYKNKAKIRNLIQSLFGITLGLTRNKISEILTYAEKNGCKYIFLGYSTLGKLAKAAKKKNIKVISFFHNVEYNYFCDRIANCSVFTKLGCVFMKTSIKRNESYAIDYSDIIILLNERDSGELHKIYKRYADIIIPITFNDSYDEKKALENDSVDKKKKILFVGSDFFGNTEGLFWFIDNCMNSIYAELIVVGSGMDKYKDKYIEKTITFKGFVEDLADEYYSADLIVLPILSGSGMKTKTCEALMYGKTIVATKEAFEGYSNEIFENKAGYLCISAEDFINSINNILQVQKSKINKESRKIFLQKYITTQYERELEKLLK